MYISVCIREFDNIAPSGVIASVANLIKCGVQEL